MAGLAARRCNNPRRGSKISASGAAHMERIGNSLRWLLACALIVLSGCATNTITGRSQLMVVSEEQAINSSS